VKHSPVSIGTKLGVGSAIVVVAAIVLGMLCFHRQGTWDHATKHQEATSELSGSRAREQHAASHKEQRVESYAAVDD